MSAHKSNDGESTLWRSAALLGGAALLSKLIGTLQKIPLQNLAGDRVFGLYSAVYALAVMWMTLAAAGVPVAVSVLVAERTAAGDDDGARRVLRWSMGLLGATGLVAFAVLQGEAAAFAGWMGVPEAADAVRTSSYALLFSPVTAALRGYSQGRMNMLRPAVSQLLEQTARVAFMLLMLFWSLDALWSPGATAAAVHGGLAAGASAGLVAMLAFRGLDRRSSDAGGEREALAGGGAATTSVQAAAADAKRADKAAGTVAGASGHASAAGAAAAPSRVRESRPALLRRIVAVALPVAAGSVVAPLFGLIDAFTLPRLLQHAGSTAAEAMSAFGEYNRGIALLQLVAMAAGGASAALVPALTAARTRGDAGGQREQAAFAMRLAWWFGGAAAIGLALLAEPVNVALFADDRGTLALALLAFAALGGTLQAVSAALLQGVGDLRSPALHLLVAALLKAALNAALAPAFGIAGAAVAAIAAYAAAAALNARALRRKLAPPPGAAATAPRAASVGAASAAGRAWAARTALALAALAAPVALLALALGALLRSLPARLGALLTALPCIAVGALAFAAALIALGLVGPREWRALPGVAGSRAERWLAKLQPRRLRHAGDGSPAAHHTSEG